jgi:hypothetical protein
MIIVCYAGGTCGDLISAMLDARQCQICANGSVQLPRDRCRLKKPHEFTDNQAKLSYINRCVGYYNSIASHDAAFHQDQAHEFLAVTVNSMKNALWAAQRFRDLHRPHVWQEMQNLCGARTVNDYAEILQHFSRMVAQTCKWHIDLSDIVLGQAVARLQDQKLDCDQTFYDQWLNQNRRLYS